MSEVVVTSLTNLRNEVRYGAGHSFITDEPITAGGEDAGPDPYTLLLAALGSCISMTVTLYARRKQWPLDRIEARLNRQPPQGKIATIALELMLGGDLDEEQKRRLLQIAERCPVHRTLTESVQITHA